MKSLRKSRPIKLVTLDTETYNGLKGKLKRIAIYDGSKVYYGYNFYDIEKILIDWAYEGYNVHIYIHNLEFDARKIPEIFRKEIIDWEKSMLISGKFAKIKTRYYTIHDSMQLLPMSLKKLSKNFQVEHGKLELWDEVQNQYPNEYSDVVDFLDKCDIDNELFLEYLGYDVMSLYEVLEKFIEVLKINLKEFVNLLSTASISRYIFKNGYGNKIFGRADKTDYSEMVKFKWYNEEIDNRPAILIEDKIRNSYCGGRCEVFKPRLSIQGFHYDVNSLYPSQFHKEYPIGRPKIIPSMKAKVTFLKWMKDKKGLGFVRAKLYIPNQHIPPLPTKLSRLVFPCGYVEGTWTYIELEYAMIHCDVEVIEYYELIHFDETYKVFSNFCDTFSKMKEEASKNHNESLRTLAKLLLNVAYGYTGMRRDDKTSLKSIDKESKYESQIINKDEELGFIEIQTDVKAEYIQVQIASYVTSYARLVLLDALKKSEGQVYYCDTDSIVTDKPFNSNIVDDARLGYWKLESQPSMGIFLRPKVYYEQYDTFETKKFKGITRDTIDTLSYEDYEKLYSELQDKTNDAIIVEKERLMLPSVHVLQKRDLDYDYYEYRDKRLNIHNTDKREMNYEKNYTNPLYFGSIKEFHNFKFVTKPAHREISL